MTVVTCIEDLRALAEKRVPKMFYQYADSGSWSESTYRNNEADLVRIRFRQRVGVSLEGRSTAGSMLGQEVAMPVAIAPTGLTGMQCADGEILAARAARDFGVPFTLSTMSICSMEDVSEGIGGAPFWFQVYVMRDRGFVERLVARARAANVSALVLTLDLPVSGQRHKDLKNGLSAPPRLTLGNLANMASKPRWWWGMLKTRRRTLGNIVGHIEGLGDTALLAEWCARQFDPTLSWEDVRWIRKLWQGKLVLKGILDEEDAHSAAGLGADAIVVSNHGGRQLDGAPSTIVALPRIAEAVGHRLEVQMDGGIRSGQDVLRALAMGARGTYIGRSMLYGLGAMGGEGVTRALHIIQKELDLTMAFCGQTRLDQVDQRILFSEAAADTAAPAAAREFTKCTFPT